VQVAGAPAHVLTDDILTEVYRQPMRVIPHPDRDCPLVLTLDDK
jgi:ABC-type hemin transport system ATPase subunit